MSVTGPAQKHPAAWLSERTFVRQFTTLSLANVLVALTSFISLAVLARALSIDDFARVIFARSASAAAFVFLDPRLEDSLLRFLPIVERDGGGGAASRLFERVLLLDQGVNAVFGALGLALVLMVGAPGGDIADGGLLAAAIVLMAVQGPVGTISAGFALTDGLARWGILQSLSTLVVTAGSLGGLALGGAEGFLIGGAAAAFLTTMALWLMAVRRTRQAYGAPSRVPQPLPPGFVSFTARAAVNSSILIGAEALPLTVVGLRSDASTLGAFRVALSPGRLASAFVSPIASIVYPRASRAAAARRSGDAAAEALRFTRRVAPVAAVVLLVGALLMPKAITITFGNSFRGSATTATLLLAAALLRGTVAWAKSLPLAFGDATRRLAVSFVDVVGLVAAAVLLANTAHAVGIGVAYVGIAFAVSAYWLTYASRKSRE